MIKYIIGIVFEYASMYWATAAVKLFFARDTHTHIGTYVCTYFAGSWAKFKTTRKEIILN